MNGPAERVHLIFDVPFNPALQGRLDTARHHRGVVVPEHLARIDAVDQHASTSYPGDIELRARVTRERHAGRTDEQISQQLNADGIPTKRYFAGSGARDAWTAALLAETFGLSRR